MTTVFFHLTELAADPSPCWTDHARVVLKFVVSAVSEKIKPPPKAKKVTFVGMVIPMQPPTSSVHRITAF